MASLADELAAAKKSNARRAGDWHDPDESLRRVMHEDLTPVLDNHAILKKSVLQATKIGKEHLASTEEFRKQRTERRKQNAAEAEKSATRRKKVDRLVQNTAQEKEKQLAKLKHELKTARDGEKDCHSAREALFHTKEALLDLVRSYRDKLAEANGTIGADNHEIVELKEKLLAAWSDLKAARETADEYADLAARNDHQAAHYKSDLDAIVAESLRQDDDHAQAQLAEYKASWKQNAEEQDKYKRERDEALERAEKATRTAAKYKEDYEDPNSYAPYNFDENGFLQGW